MSEVNRPRIIVPEIDEGNRKDYHKALNSWKIS